VDEVKKAITGVKRLVAVEENATGQLATLAEQHGIAVYDRILRYDGRPFSPEDLLAKVKGVIV
jgi:2-oxoglutarate ferredoxin oxidoreductase subunit alpha